MISGENKKQVVLPDDFRWLSRGEPRLAEGLPAPSECSPGYSSPGRIQGVNCSGIQGTTSTERIRWHWISMSHQ